MRPSLLRMRKDCGWSNFWLPSGLAVLLALQPTAFSQAPPNPTPTAAQSPATVRTLRILPLAGNHEFNDLQNKVMAPLVVQVLDVNDLPVEGTDVVFRFPLNGASATFDGGQNAKTFRTNVDGQAAATGWTANGTVGSFRVQVTASRGTEQGSAVISMTNVTRITEAQKKSSQNKKWWSSRWGKVAIGAGAAAIIVGIILAVHGGSNTHVITATPGAPTIGGPQ